MEEKRRRFAIEVTDEQYLILKTNLPHGMQKLIFSIVIQDMCGMYNKYGQLFNIALMNNQLSYDSMIKRFVERQCDNEAKGFEDSFQPPQ